MGRCLPRASPGLWRTTGDCFKLPRPSLRPPRPAVLPASACCGSWRNRTFGTTWVRSLVAEARVRELMKTGEILVEAPFGLGGDSPDVLDEATGLRFRGLIDRVDISADGKSVLVMDYKTGSPRPYADLDKDSIDHGKRLQLGIYSLAAQHMAPEATEVTAAYWLASERGGFRFAPRERFSISDPDTAKRFRDGVTTVVSGISQGVFPANPGEMGLNGFVNCRYCDFDTLCPSRRGYIWETKKGDDAAAIYRQLSEGSPEEPGSKEG